MDDREGISEDRILRQHRKVHCGTGEVSGNIATLLYYQVCSFAFEEVIKWYRTYKLCFTYCYFVF